MKKLSVSGLMLAAFLVGCAAAMVAAPLVVPPVRAGTSPTKWEYKCELTDANAETTTALANKFGAEGWEIASGVAASNGWGTYCFKRPL